MKTVSNTKSEENQQKEKAGSPKDQKLIEQVEKLCSERKPFQHIQALDHPRMAGSPEENQAAKYIENFFRAQGFEPHIEEFYLPPSSKMPKLVLPLFIIGWGVFSFINVIIIRGILEYVFACLILLVPILIVLMLIKLEVIFRRMLTRNFQKIQQHTEQIKRGIYKKPVQKGINIYAEYAPEVYQEHLYLTAHYDSTTLKLKMKVIKLFTVIGMLGFLIYVFGYLAHYILLIFTGSNLFTQYFGFFLSVLIISLISLSFVLFSRVFRANESHGAIDNLTGTALLLELANIAKVVKPKLKITFIAFSAEEVGLIGSAYHFNIHKESFPIEKLRVVSIDMIGEIPPLTIIKSIKPVLGLPMDPEFNDQIAELAQKLGINLKQGKFMYPGSDFASWLLNGYKTNWLMNPSRFIHSPQDIGQNVNQTLLNEGLRLLTAYLLNNS
jgi:hypothetical protein